MSNMSAQILRNIVSSVFNVPANKVRLSGTISPDWTGEYVSGIDYMDYTECGDKAIYGFIPTKGFIAFNEAITQKEMYHGNHDCHYTEGLPLHEVASGEEVFFVTETFSDENGNTESIYTLYKAPNFAQLWAELEVADIQRWEEWAGQS